MRRIALDRTKDRDAAIRPLPISVTDSAQELLSLETLVRQAIPMIERPHDFCTGKRMRLADELKAALRCRDEHTDGVPLPSDDNAPIEEQYTADYWLQEEQE